MATFTVWRGDQADSADRVLRVWDAETGKELAVFRGYPGQQPLYAAFFPDGRRVVSVGTAATAHVWDAATGKELLVLTGHTRAINYASVAPDGRVVTASEDLLGLEEQEGRLHVVPVRVVVGDRAPSGGEVEVEDARLDDGLLDVLVFQNQSHWDLIRYFQAIVFGNHPALPDVEYFQSRGLRLTSREPVEPAPHRRSESTAPAMTSGWRASPR